MALGKGIAGGYVPLAAAITTPRIADSFRNEPGNEFRNGITYSGHTLACTSALAVIDAIEKENLINNATQMGEYLAEQLNTRVGQHRLFSHVSGIGLLRAINLADDVADKPVGDWIRDWCYDNGMVLRNNGNILVFAPALIITAEQIDWVVDRIEQALNQAAKHFGL
jgi:adenosylmethionine-8-amino-7-oxononanoate aminotransferase